MSAKPGGVLAENRITEATVMEAITRFRGGELLTTVAASLGVTTPALSYHFRKRGLSARSPARTSQAFCLNCHAKYEYRLHTMRRGKERKYCSRRCLKEHNVGKNHALWGGGKRTINGGGYVIVQIPSGHPMGTRSRKRHRMAEHIVVAEQMIGRPLERTEVVHHINGNKQDNRPINLLVCTRSYHIWLHAQMSYLYQQEHFGHL